MPTSSERLKARSNAYMEAHDYLMLCAEAAKTVTEAHEYEKVANRLYIEYDRLNALAKVREEKEQGFESRRGT